VKVSKQPDPTQKFSIQLSITKEEIKCYGWSPFTATTSTAQNSLESNVCTIN